MRRTVPLAPRADELAPTAADGSPAPRADELAPTAAHRSPVTEADDLAFGVGKTSVITGEDEMAAGETSPGDDKLIDCQGRGVDDIGELRRSLRRDLETVDVTLRNTQVLGRERSL